MSTISLPKAMLALLVALSVVGCSDPNMPDMGQVSGKVTMDGQPISKGRIVFQPQNGPSCMAETDEAGNYEIMFDKNTPGAVLGPNVVSISTHRFARENGELVEHKETVPPQFNVESTLKFDVQPGAQTKDWELTSN